VAKKGIVYSLDAAMAAVLLLFLLLSAHSFNATQQAAIDFGLEAAGGAAEAIAYSENGVDGGGEHCVTRLKNGGEETFCGRE
jgi:hypothetical protein